MLSWPQAALDYYPYIEKRMATLGSLIYDVETETTKGYVWNEHMEVLRRGIDSRTEIYKFIFIIS